MLTQHKWGNENTLHNIKQLLGLAASMLQLQQPRLLACRPRLLHCGCFSMAAVCVWTISMAAHLHTVESSAHWLPIPASKKQMITVQNSS
jgi:membrane-associated PAP2 superfamily phosphatase